MTRSTDRYDVVVVGAGLVGLASAALLAQQGVHVLTVERHAGTSVHPKARLVTVRSMEIYRALGIEAEVRAAGEPNLGFDVADSLADGVQTWIAPPADEVSSAGFSPTSPYSCDQQRLEPILLRRALERGGVAEFSTTATLVDADELGATLDLLAEGTTRRVHARYVIAADGHRSGLRQQLGIAMTGEDVAGESVSAVFRAALEPALHGREVNAVMCRAAGAFLFARGNREDRSWQLGTYLRPGWGDLPPEMLQEHLVEVIRVATGLPELDVTIEDHARWRTGAYLADRFRSGPVFLVGDAAHVMPPYGGFGGNTGVQDAHNLAWKIAAVLRGDAPDTLLDTYERERQPLDRLVVAQALLRSQKKPGDPPPPDQIDATALTLGFRYQNGGRVEDPASPSGDPGTRAPHVALTDGRSTLDLIDPTGFTLIGHPDIDQELSATHNVRVVGIARDDVAASFRPRWDAMYARGDGAGLLIRPDGVIAAALVHPTPANIASALSPHLGNEPVSG